MMGITSTVLALNRVESALFAMLLDIAAFTNPGPTQRTQALTDINNYIGISIRATSIIDTNRRIFFSA
jgi:hypothetical protein